MKATDKNLNNFWAKVKTGPGCWVWTGARTRSADRNRGSYGTFGAGGKARFAHRWIFQVLKGVVLDKKIFVCHRCDNSLCVRPDHLYAGTAKQNMADMVKRSRMAFRDKCKNGHERSGQNTSSFIGFNGKRYRRCLDCAAQATRKFNDKVNPDRNRRKGRRSA